MFNSKVSTYQLVNTFGKLWASETDLQQTELLLQKCGNIDPLTMFEVTRTQRVTPQVGQHLQALKAKGLCHPFLDPFLAQAKSFLEEKTGYISHLFTNLERFAEAANRVGTQFMVVKGACLQYLYPTGSFRDMGDIDLVISAETVWEGMNAFKEIRHRPKRVRLESYPYSALGSGQQAGGTFGIAEMFDVDGNPRRYPFDLHLGGFPGCGDGLLEVDLWKRAIPLQVGAQEILMPSLEDCVLIICSHTSRHGYAKLRDLNDIHVCLKHAASDFDWDYVFYFSEKNSLQAILYGLLDRFKVDSDIEVPAEIFSNLKPKGFEGITSKTLFSAGRDNPNFHGGRQLVLGRFLQAAFLHNYYKGRTGFFRAFKESLGSLYYLFQSGRPYRLWKRREIQSFRSNRRIVMIPIDGSMDKMRWDIERIHLQKVEEFALREGVAVEWISDEIIVWNVGHSGELVLTPEGIYTQSAYNGDIDETALESLERIAWELVTRLKEVGGIEAESIEVFQ